MSLPLSPALNNTPRAGMQQPQLSCSLFSKKTLPKLQHNLWCPCAATSPCCLTSLSFLCLLPFSGQGPPFHPLPVQHRAPQGLLAVAGVSGGSPNTNNNNLQSASLHAAAPRADSGFPHLLLPISPCNTHLAAREKQCLGFEGFT